MTHEFSNATQKAILTTLDKIEQELAPSTGSGLPVSIEDMAGDAALGGKLGIQDVATPYLYVLQTMSPQVNPDNSKFVEGARAGMFYLTALERAFEGRETGLNLVLCHYERLIVEWRQREAGGGYAGSHDPESEILGKAKQNERGFQVLPNGNVLTETAYHYVMVNEPGRDEWWQAIMPLKSTGLKVSRKVNYELATTFIPGTRTPAPRFLHSWQLRSVKETRDQYTWSNVSLRKQGVVAKDVYAMAKAFAVMAARGTLRRSVTEEAMEPSQAPVKEDGKIDDDALPF